MASRATLVWLRQDLRLSDNPALAAARQRDAAVIPVHIAEHDLDGASPGAAARWWLHHSLTALDGDLRRRGSRLILRQGDALTTLQELLQTTGADAVMWNRRYEPDAAASDAHTAAALMADGVAVQEFNAALLYDPERPRTKAGEPFQVFSAYWRACSRLPQPAAPVTRPRSLPAPARWPHSESLGSLGLLPRVDWGAGMREVWEPGERGAARQLRRFLRRGLAQYPDGRDRPGVEGTSRLSPHLHFGEIGPRQIWHAVLDAHGAGSPRAPGESAESFLRELGWREFAHHLLRHFPHTVHKPLREQFAHFPWRRDKRALRAWQRGLTGYPVVDAGMRELWTTGWMHNRVRMIAASFLVKHLLIHWHDGAAWFWDTLVDADLASNTLNWQWVAGSGADAAPYFRIFNPVLQGRKFDPGGVYVRRWVPEIARLGDRWVHAPWEAPADVLAAAGVRLGREYPAPIVAHDAARDRALGAFAGIRGR